MPPPAANDDRPVGLSDVKCPFTQFARSFCEKLPRSNRLGQLAYKPKDVTGSASTKALEDPRNILGEKEVRRLLKEKVPCFPLVDVPTPEVRAKSLLSKNVGKLAKFPEIVQQAANQFRIPEGQRMLLIGPEYFCRDKLFDVEKFQVKNKHGVVTGVLPLCPWCKSNTGVLFRTWECQNLPTMSRCAVHTDATRLQLIGGRYWCKNNECCGEEPDGDLDDELGVVHMKDKKGQYLRDGQGNVKTWYRRRANREDHSFVIWNRQCFQQFPDNVKKIYSRFVSGLAHDFDGSEPKLLPTPQLALDLLDTSNNFCSLTNRLQTHFDVLKSNARQAYYDFVNTHGQTYAEAPDYFGLLPADHEPTVVPWPDFDEAAFQQELCPPKGEALENVFWITFQMVKPYLERDLLSRRPGRILRWDGTRSAAKKIISDDDLDKIGTLLLITGEYGDIVSYAFAHDEGQVDWQILHYFLMKRCERMGHKVLYDVKYGYDDLGSMNYKDPSKHWFASIWPSAQRGPRKDPLHAVMLVGRSTYAHQHPMNDWFSRELTSCLMEFETWSVNAAIRQFRSENTNTTYELAKNTVTTQKSWKRKLFNRTVSIAEQRRRVESLWQKAIAEDIKYQEEGHPPFLLKQTAARRGTSIEMDLLLSHIKRGDYQDPLPARQMSFVRRTAYASNAQAPRKTKSGLDDLARLRGTNTVESSNKQINASVQNATRMRGELVAARVLLRIHSHNLEKDRLFGAKTGRTAKPLFWFLHEANDHLASTINCLKSKAPTMQYPPVDFLPEPLGLQFEHYKKYLAKEDIEYLDAVHHDRSPPKVTPSAATPPTTDGETTTPSSTADNDGEYGDAALDEALATLDVDALVAKHQTASANQIDPYSLSSSSPSPAPPSTTPPRRKRRSPGSASTASSKKKRYHSGGATVYNRKEGNRSMPSPIRFTAQLPLSPGQNERAATVLNHLSSAGVPKNNISATGTAKSFMEAWNHLEYSSSLKGELPMGTMSIGVAESLTREMTNSRVKARADGANIELTTTLDMQSGLKNNPPKKKKPHRKKKAPPKQPQQQQKRERGRPKKEIAPLLELHQLNNDIIANLGADAARQYIVKFNEQYAKPLSIRPASIPGNRAGRRLSLLNLVDTINRKQTTTTK